jgi:hypothetical protein
MYSFSRRIKRAVVALAVITASLLTHGNLPGLWAIYITLCVAYTIVVVGMVWVDGKLKLYFARENRAGLRFLQIHLAFLLAAVVLLWLSILAEPAMPDWLVSRGGESWSWYHVLVIILMVGLVVFEQYWIEKPFRRSVNPPS